MLLTGFIHSSDPDEISSALQQVIQGSRALGAGNLEFLVSSKSLISAVMDDELLGSKVDLPLHFDALCSIFRCREGILTDISTLGQIFFRIIYIGEHFALGRSDLNMLRLRGRLGCRRLGRGRLRCGRLGCRRLSCRRLRCGRISRLWSLSRCLGRIRRRFRGICGRFSGICGRFSGINRIRRLVCGIRGRIGRILIIIGRIAGCRAAGKCRSLRGVGIGLIAACRQQQQRQQHNSNEHCTQ